MIWIYQSLNVEYSAILRAWSWCGFNSGGDFTHFALIFGLQNRNINLIIIIIHYLRLLLRWDELTHGCLPQSLSSHPLALRWRFGFVQIRPKANNKWMHRVDINLPWFCYACHVSIWWVCQSEMHNDQQSQSPAKTIRILATRNQINLVRYTAQTCHVQRLGHGNYVRFKRSLVLLVVLKIWVQDFEFLWIDKQQMHAPVQRAAFSWRQLVQRPIRALGFVSPAGVCSKKNKMSHMNKFQKPTCSIVEDIACTTRKKSRCWSRSSSSDSKGGWI